MSIERPYELVTLPLPLDRSNGQTFFSAVHGVSSDGRPKKRPKLAVGIDGEGVNIYDVHPLKLDSSYALPPQSKFTCAPCCIHQKLKKLGTQKSTYASIQDPTPKLLRFSEIVKTESEAGDDTASSFEQRELDRGGRVVQVLPWFAKGGLDVLVVYADGLLQCLSGDLSSEVWRATLKTGAAALAFESGQIEAVELHQSSVLKEGIFRDRPDMLVSLEGNDATVLSVIISSPHANTVALYTIQAGDIFTSASCLSSQRLNLPGGISGSPQIRLDLTKGKSTIAVGHQLLRYNISEPDPELEYEAAIGTTPFSLLPISDFAVLLANGTDISLVNTTYGSIYAQQSASLDSETSGKKRKRDDTSAQSMHLVEYYPAVNLAIARTESTLIGIQVSLLDSSRRKLTGGLVDTIGKPSMVSAKKAARPSSRQQRSDELIAKLARSVSKGDSVKFEQRLASFLGVSRRGETARNLHSGKVNGTTKHANDESDGSPWTPPDTLKTIPPKLRSYLESTLFAFDDGHFKIAFEAPNLLRYLIEVGQVEVCRLYTTNGLPEPNGALCRAITERYPELTSILFDKLIPLPVTELLGLVRHYLNSRQEQSFMKAITALHRSYSTPAITRAMRKFYNSDDLNDLFSAISNLFLSSPQDEYLSATFAILTSLLDASALAFTLPIQPIHAVLPPLITDLNSCVSLKSALESVLEYSQQISLPIAGENSQLLLEDGKTSGPIDGVISSFSPGQDTGSALPLDTLTSKDRNHGGNTTMNMAGKYSIERIEV